MSQVLRKLFRSSRNGGAEIQSGAASSSVEANDPGAVARHAATLVAAGRHAEALAALDAALLHAAKDPMLMFARGSTLFELGRHHEARDWLLNAAARGLEDAVLFLQAGWSSIWTAGPPSGERWMRKAIEIDPDNWMGHFGLGMSLHGQNRIDEAVISFESALSLSPDSATCLTQLFGCRYKQNRFVEAEAFARRAVAVNDRIPKNWINLGVALIRQDRFGEASDAFERAEALDLGRGEGDEHLNLGICLRETGRTAEALAYYDRKLPALASVGAHAHFGHALLTAGKLLEGWPQYEFRWMQNPLLPLRASTASPCGPARICEAERYCFAASRESATSSSSSGMRHTSRHSAPQSSCNSARTSVNWRKVFRVWTASSRQVSHCRTSISIFT